MPKRRTPLEMLDAVETTARKLALELITRARFGGKFDLKLVLRFRRVLRDLADRSRKFKRGPHKTANFRDYLRAEKAKGKV